MFEKLTEMVRGGLEAAAQFAMPHVVDVRFPESSPAAGALAGRLVLQRGPGTSEYKLQALAPFKAEPALAELVESHAFDGLADLQAFLDNGQSVDFDAAVVFVKAAPDMVAEIMALDPAHPERALFSMSVQRHPAWLRWVRGAGNGNHVDLSHHALADLVLDNREDLAQPALADHLAAFNSAREVEYDANLGDGGHEGVKVRWKGRGGKEGATSNLDIPREFTASIPAYTGAWAPGQEPRHEATFRLRVLPPEGDGPPTFRLLWVNHADFELAAARALVACVREVMGDRPVYAGRPRSQRFVLPRPSEG